MEKEQLGAEGPQDITLETQGLTEDREERLYRVPEPEPQLTLGSF